MNQVRDRSFEVIVLVVLAILFSPIIVPLMIVGFALNGLVWILEHITGTHPKQNEGNAT
jgi:nitrate reductase NapE component